MLNLKIGEAQRFFFDKERVLHSLDRATAGALSRIGAFVRRTAKGSIRAAKKPSRIGDPPHSHTGLLREHIYFVYDAGRRSVVIGPALLNGMNTELKPVNNTVPGILERGGSAQRVVHVFKSGHKKKKTVEITCRPYMGPALTKELPKFKHEWKNAIGP